MAVHVQVICNRCGDHGYPPMERVELYHYLFSRKRAEKCSAYCRGKAVHVQVICKNVAGITLPSNEKGRAVPRLHFANVKS